MEITVIIAVRNRPGPLDRCLAALRKQTLPPDRWETIVVDNGSTDATPRVAAQYGARVIEEPQPNRCRARNTGVRHARTPWVAFTDSDCEPQPGWLTSLLQTIETFPEGSPVAALAGRIDPATPVTPAEAYIARHRWVDQAKFLAPGRSFSPPFAATANLAVRRDVFVELGGLDPALATAGEDADWCWRAREAGYQIQYQPEAVVLHRHRASTGAMWRQAYRYGVGNAELFAKWRTKWGAHRWVEPRHPAWALKALVKTPWCLVTGRDPLERRMAWFDCLANTAMTLGRMRGGLRHRVLVI